VLVHNPRIGAGRGFLQEKLWLAPLIPLVVDSNDGQAVGSCFLASSLEGLAYVGLSMSRRECSCGHLVVHGESARELPAVNCSTGSSVSMFARLAPDQVR
jgi:hypothetical protein